MHGAVKRKTIRSKYVILTPTGEQFSLNLEKLREDSLLREFPVLTQFILSEEVKGQPSLPPPSIKLMKKLELVDYEPASDIGHMRFLPKGTLIFDLLTELANSIAEEIGTAKVRTPLMYKLSEQDIRKHIEHFLARAYKLKVGKRAFILGFASDFGLFRMMKDVAVSYRQLPLRLYDFHPSFRMEQSGECVGLRRLRYFWMPDIHSFCSDIEQGMEEYANLLRHYTKLVHAMEVEYAIAFRTVESFFREHRQWFLELLKIAAKPALIELLPKTKHYWVVKHEYQSVDSVGGNAQLCTVQLDLEDSKRYGITYVDRHGNRKGCIIIHSSMGSIERWIYAILEEAEKMKKAGKPPALPLWLSPTQVRIIPVSETALEYARSISEKIAKQKIRVDIDDKDETVAKKVRNSETEWVPRVLVIGEKEMQTNRLPVRIRETNQIKEMTISELIEDVKTATRSKPFKPLALTLLSRRPIFSI